MRFPPAHDSRQPNGWNPQDLNLSVAEDDDDGALQAIASLACAFRHPARLAHINGIAAAARKAGFDASVRAFKDVVQALPNAPEPEVRSAFISQLAQLGARMQLEPLQLGTLPPSVCLLTSFWFDKTLMLSCSGCLG